MRQAIDQFCNARVLVVGDAMLDRYYFSDVTRISPEGPVPVAHVRSEKNTLGGAANVVHNLARLGCQVSMVSVTGADANRAILLEKMNTLGVDYSGMIELPDRPTTTKLRVLGGHQQMLRIDFESKESLSRCAEEQLLQTLDTTLSEKHQAVILSDYAKGVCTTAVCQWVIAKCRALGIALVVDPKGSNWQKYLHATLVTPNLRELAEASRERLSNDENGKVVRAATKLMKKYDFSAVVVTRSEKGMSLVSESKPIHIPTYAQEVFDVSGAGDTVAAVLGAALAVGCKLSEAAHLANVAAGVVVGKLGTYAISNQELSTAIRGMSEGRCAE